MEDHPLPIKNTPHSSSRRPRGSQVPVLFLPLLFAIGLGTGYLLWHPAPFGRSTTPAAATSDNTQQQQQAYKRYDIPIENEPSLGPADAPITLVMYSDYECPFCKKWYLEVFKPLEANYAGKIRFIYKDFPLYGKHENAAPAAEAANCAGDQGKYWEYQDKLFNGELAYGAETYIKYASDLQLDANQYQECLTSRKFEKEVQEDYDFASQLGIQSTPTFFINGIPMIGAQPLASFEQLIDQELAGNIPTS
jgi:protein-disulfide isomerase